ncbi:hypothetical protein D1BOALGB6SA_3937 [Olavius sp. associated proteobacterium Delta 1]|nr:hypothetical protein D1BOALGB6SA_3937 [Olavius sp. associated proteobacterium Delta 1]
MEKQLIDYAWHRWRATIINKGFQNTNGWITHYFSQLQSYLSPIFMPFSAP